MSARTVQPHSRLCWAVALAVAGVAGCPGPPAAAPPASSERADRFSAIGYAQNVSTLVKLGARAPGSAALASARTWAQANASVRGEPGGIVIAAPLVASDASGDALAEQSSGLAVAIELARALAANGAPVAVVLDDGALTSSPPLAGAALVVYVSRACGLPTRRDLLSHRVLRERFFRSAGVEPPADAFEQARAPHAELLAAGARRVVAIDAPAEPGMPCDPGPLGDALVRFVRDASELLARSRVNARAPLASQRGS